MKKTIYFGLSFLSIFLLIACGKEEKKSSQENQTTQAQQQATVKQIAVGAEAPDFTLQSMDGKEVKLSDFKGKKVYINMWASWCGPCMREIPELEKTYQKLKDNKDIVFLSMTSPNDAEFKNQSPQDKGKDVILNKAKELGVTYPVLFDVNDRFIINYAIRSFPTHIFINSDGTIGNRIAGGVTEELLTKEIEKLK